MKKFYKILLIILAAILFAAGALAAFSETTIISSTNKYIFNDIEQLPDGQVALVLGTAKYNNNGGENPFYTYRMRAAKELYDAGKVRAFVVSGDNRKKNYNEPEAMRSSLVQLGIPNALIYPDYAGFRTLDSVVRIKKVFGQQSCIIVSQKFHNQRAVYLAQKNGIEAYGYNAQDVPLSRSFKTFVRERLARVKVFVDILIKKEPKFLGEPVEIKQNNAAQPAPKDE